MKQLLLGIDYVFPDYNTENLVVTESNKTAFNFIKNWPNWPSPIALINGERGSGKTHLAKAWKERSLAFETQDLDLAIEKARQGYCILIDGINVFNDEKLFHLINTIYQARLNYQDTSLLITSRLNIKNWHVKLPDLLSRLRLIVNVTINQPDEQLLRAVILKLFCDRQIEITNILIDYILIKSERSLDYVTSLVELCDKISLENKSKVTKLVVQQAIEKLNK